MALKRRAEVPIRAVILSERVSKADLLEAAWYMASLSNEAGSCDDDESTLDRLVFALDRAREWRGAKPVIKP